MNSILLDGKMSSLLDFRCARIEALKKIAQGEKILWELDLGLFKGLTYPFGNETEARSMLLAIEHFTKTLWSEFKDYSEGVVLYNGELNFDPYLFSEYLKFLTLNLSDTIPVILNFTLQGERPLEVARHTTRGLYPRFEIRVEGKEPPYRSFESKIGFLLPSNGDQAFEQILARNIEPRAIAEIFLVSEWDGLDYLVVDPAHLNKEALRKLRGFCAAGGIVVSLNEPLGMSEEMLFDREFLMQHL